MAVYIIRLYADSLVRLNQKPYLEEGAARSLALNLPGVTVAVFDRFVSVGDVEVPRGLIVQVGLEASDIDEAVAKAKGIASYLLSMLCCVTLASVEQPKPIWVYDASPGAEDRDYRHFAYENECAVLSTRRLEDANLFALLERNFNSFLSDVAIREDWKERVQRAIQSFRRGLADNDDVLTEFIIAWSSMEGLDCVYRKVLPSALTRDFMDGVRDVLDRLGRADLFETLKDLRDGLAHGNISLVDATRTAEASLELIRQAFVLMILRILGVEEAVSDKVLKQAGYKGKFAPFVKVLATIRFEPGDVTRLDAHPIVEVTCAGVEAIRAGEKLTLKPNWRVTQRNLGGMALQGYELWGDAGSRMEFGSADVRSIPGPGRA